MYDNPFTPGFGDEPPFLAGRSSLIEDISRRLKSKPVTRNRCFLVLGARGIGKTAGVHGVAKHVSELGWASLHTSVRPEASGRESVISQIARQCEVLRHGRGKRRELTGVSGPFGLGAEFETRSPGEHPPPLRETLADTIDHVRDRTGKKGVIVVVDEVHNISRRECGIIGSAVQEVITVDKENLGFIGMGLPQMEFTHLNDPGFTFLQRCHRVGLGALSFESSVEALQRPLEAGAVRIPEDDLRRMAAGTMGYGYAIQSVGYHLWEICGGARTAASPADVNDALRRMDEDIAQHIVTPVWSSLTPKEVEVLMAIASHEGLVSLADVTRAVGDSAREYKKRLLHKGVIREIGTRALLTFASTAVKARAEQELEAERAAVEENRRRRNEIDRQA